MRAVLAGLAMLERLEEINRAEDEQIQVGIGVNTGLAMAGYLGTEERVEFTVLGDAVNVAYRLESHARPNRVYIGPFTSEAVTGKLKLRPVGPVKVKGRTEPIQTYEVLRV